MEMNQTTFNIMQSLLFLVVLAGVVFAIFFYFGQGNVTKDAVDVERKAELTRLQTSAGAYYSRLRFFDGVCQDIGVPTPFTCNETSDAYAIDIQLTNGTFYCADSTGFRGAAHGPINDKTVCER